LTSLGGSARNPVWSSTGDAVYFDFIPGPCHLLEARRETWVMRAGGGGTGRWAVNLGDPGVALSFPFALGGPFDRCAVGRRDSTGSYGVIFAMNLDGSRRTQLTRP
jgi:hypothetical protein